MSFRLKTHTDWQLAQRDTPLCTPAVCSPVEVAVGHDLQRHPVCLISVLHCHQSSHKLGMLNRPAVKLQGQRVQLLAHDAVAGHVVGHKKGADVDKAAQLVHLC